MSPFSTCVRCTLWCSACTVAAAWAKVVFPTSGRAGHPRLEAPSRLAAEPSLGRLAPSVQPWSLSLRGATQGAEFAALPLPPPGTAPYLDFELQCVGGNCAVAVESASADAVRDEILETYRIPSPASPELCAEQ